MTQEQIIEDNKLIAEFMGVDWKYRRITNYQSKYHKSYDWLIPVVEKIENLGYDYEITNNGIFDLDYYCVFYHDYDNDPRRIYSDSSSKKSLIEVIYKATVKFIKYYNKQESK